MLSRAQPATTAIVFVHGWGGDANGTWEAFPAALRALPKAASADVFFIQYRSTTMSASVCGLELEEFLHDLLRDPAASVVNPSLPPDTSLRPAAARYSRIVIVAHSMGAVVSRRALLNLDRKGLSPEEQDTIRLLFIAPAHIGSELPDLIASGLGLDWLPGASSLGRLLSVRYKSLADLKRKSDCLELLAADSVAARARRAAAKMRDDDLRARVVHAHGDKVVYQDRFDEDDERRPIANRHHRSVCKPDETFRRPVDELDALL